MGFHSGWGYTVQSVFSSFRSQDSSIRSYYESGLHTKQNICGKTANIVSWSIYLFIHKVVLRLWQSFVCRDHWVLFITVWLKPEGLLIQAELFFLSDVCPKSKPFPDQLIVVIWVSASGPVIFTGAYITTPSVSENNCCLKNSPLDVSLHSVAWCFILTLKLVSCQQREHFKTLSWYSLMQRLFPESLL